jgi:hypothetical protein
MLCLATKPTTTATGEPNYTYSRREYKPLGQTPELLSVRAREEEATPTKDLTTLVTKGILRFLCVKWMIISVHGAGLETWVNRNTSFAISVWEVMGGKGGPRINLLCP